MKKLNNNNSKSGKHKCDDDMLKELDVLEPENIRKIDRKLIRAIIGTKRKFVYLRICVFICFYVFFFPDQWST